VMSLGLLSAGWRFVLTGLAFLYVPTFSVQSPETRQRRSSL
jgi:hypothetical protein